MIEFAFAHRFGTTALDIAFSAPTPGVTILFGPSGSGKSTCITALAGLLRPARGRIVVDGTVLLDTGAGVWLPPERRRVGLVFQDARLFPHLSVESNLLYGRRRSPAAAPGAARIGLQDVLDLLGIGALLRRRPHTLSGGERQRVAIGRALLAQPRLLLLDEPLASLDAPRRAEILPYLARLKASLALPVVYVTHALDEMLALGDTLVLLEAGRTVAAGPVADLAARGDVPLLAARDGAASLIVCRVAAHDPERRLTLLHAGGLSIWVPLLDRTVDAAARVRIAARDVILATEAPRAVSVHNVLAGRVRGVTEDRARHAALVEVAIGGSALLARVTLDAVDHLRLSVGGDVVALVKSVSVDVLPG